MNKKTPNIKPTGELTTLINSLFNDKFDIELITLCTADGFDIFSTSKNQYGIEGDKIAAIASSLCSLGNAASEQILKNEFIITIVETNNGDILFLKTTYMKYSAVLTIATNKKMSLGEARFLAIKASEQISELL